MVSNGFNNVKIRKAIISPDKMMIHVNNVFELVQAVGYIKFMLAQKGYGIAFRGQHKQYPHLTPSLYHQVENLDDFVKKNQKIDKLQEDIVQQAKDFYQEKYPAYKDAFFEFNNFFTFPVLQHYGIETSWLDLVDNIWIALWFACNLAKIDDSRGIKEITYQQIKNDECFIYLVRIPLENDTEKPGVYSNCESTLIDLRSCIPSYFIRPHMQHGLLLQKKYPIISDKIWLMDEFIEGIVKINVSIAHQILGNGESVKFSSLFPNKSNDHGLEKLLNVKCLQKMIHQNTSE